MKPIYKFLLNSVLLTTLFAACNKDEQLSLSGDQTAVSISAGFGASGTVDTRAADAAWASNDRIGITMLEYPIPAQTDGAPPVGVINGYSNREYVTGGDGKFSPYPSDKIMYYPVNGDKVTFKAYYPYSSTLPANFVKPVDVASQNDLAAIDLMTAEHTGDFNTKDQPDVNLKFYHRLSKVVINLDAETPIDLTNCQLVLKGMKTTGSYDLMKEKLSVNDASEAEITIPLTGNTGKAILLPREAGDGVTFQVTTKDGGVYTARMASDLALEAGHKYTFNLTLKTTPAVVTAIIEPWTEGTTKSMEVVRLVTDLGTNKDFKDNDQLKLYLKDTKTSTGGVISSPEFALATTFTYQAAGDVWTPLTPLYWENIYGDPVDFRGTSVLAAKLNTTQMDDILISDDTPVNQYKGVNLEMKHAGSKVTIELKSTDDTFSSADLTGATVTLPNYRNSGTLNAATGAFEISAGTGNIVPENAVAIFPPQTIPSGNTVVKVVINGRTYEVKAEAGGFIYAKGTAYKMTLDLKKANVLISTVIADWTSQDLGTKTVTIGTASLTASGGDLNNGDQLFLYTGTDAGRTELSGYFTYSVAGNTWTYSNPSTPLYWENIANTGNIYASITRDEITPGNNQSKDYITATPITNDGGKSNTALNFEMSHQVAQVQIRLTSSSNAYTEAELKTAEIILPGYKTGGALNNGVYTPGASTGDIQLAAPNNATITTFAYLQPQTISAPTTLVKVKINGREYPISHTVAYEAGQITHLNIDIKASEVKVSVSVKPWENQDPVAIKFFFTEAQTSVRGFENDDQIRFYKMNNPISSGVSDNKNTCTYTVSGSTASLTSWTKTWYRDDFQPGDQFVGVFPASASDFTSGAKTFPWTCKGDNTGTPITNNHQDDVLVSQLSGTGSTGLVVGGSANVSLDFIHVLSKITVNIYPDEGFTLSELQNAANASTPTLFPLLLNFKMAGNVDVTSATATPSGTTVGEFRPTKLGTVPTGAAASYEALIMPQTFGSNHFIDVSLDGKIYNAIASGSSYPFEPGKNHVFNIYLKKTGILLTTKVEPWGTGTGGSITIQ